MKKFLKKNYLLIICIIIQTIMYMIAGSNKLYLHLDEAYSYGLANYDKMELQENADFYDNWHKKEYYTDYLSIQENEKGNYNPVYENQKNDVHPPIFYLLLRFSMELTGSHFTMWTGMGLNIITYAFITIFIYLILKKLLQGENNCDKKATIVAFASSIMLAAISNVTYIRMYCLSALNILITVYLHIKLLESQKVSLKLWLAIGISALVGVLTHYYYLFYLVILYLIFFVKYIRQKEIRKLIYYTVTMCIAAIVCLIIFPYCINHMFLGYRGQGVLSNLGNIYEILISLFPNIHNLNYYGFNNLLWFIIPLAISTIIYRKVKKKEKVKLDKEKKEILKLLYLPTIFFFVIASIASPWKVLRYIVPVCAIIFILVIYGLYQLLKNVFTEKISSSIIIVLLCLSIITPFAFQMNPELLYTDKKEIVEQIKTKKNLPAIYFKNNTGNFLDDILLFTILDESYIIKSATYTEDKIQDILQEKDVSKGIFVFISKDEKEEPILQTVKNVTGLENSKHLEELNSCNVYVMK
ncbi:MAG: hypothetical protein HFJ28_02545 [Clostridia bacterium]|jgi:hypothetical protein|nr:hypothetical protein [Clostridia bacterium]